MSLDYRYLEQALRTGQFISRQQAIRTGRKMTDWLEALSPAYREGRSFEHSDLDLPRWSAELLQVLPSKISATNLTHYSDRLHKTLERSKGVVQWDRVLALTAQYLAVQQFRGLQDPYKPLGQQLAGQYAQWLKGIELDLDPIGDQVEQYLDTMRDRDPQYPYLNNLWELSDTIGFQQGMLRIEKVLGSTYRLMVKRSNEQKAQWWLDRFVYTWLVWINETSGATVW